MRNANINSMIIERLNENKSGVKTYATYEGAVEKADVLSKAAIAAFGGNPERVWPVDYVIAAVNGRFAIVFMMSSWLNANKLGGYIGFFAAHGHMSV